MSALLDVLGAMVIGSMLMLMMITFQYQLRDTADTVIYMSGMIDHMEKASAKLNDIVALAGIGFSPATTVTIADTNRLEFNTMWNYQTMCINQTGHVIKISLANNQTPLGRALTVYQDSNQIEGMGTIFWVDALRFVYFDKQDNATTTPSLVRSAELWLTFRHNAPKADQEPLHTKLQMRCYFMNAYLAGG